MADELNGMRVAILVTDGFEQVELTEPRKALDQAGADTRIVSPKDERVRGWKFTDWGEELPVDRELDGAQPEDFDALLLPGGVINPDALRTQPQAVAFAKAFFDAGKPVASICHGPWTIIETGAAQGRRMTSWPSLQTDLRNAGAEWVDQEAVVDRGLVTSRSPDDIPAFNRSMIDLFSRGRGQAQRTACEGAREGPTPVRPHRARCAPMIGDSRCRQVAHYGANVKVLGDGRHTLRVRVAPPVFVRHDRVNGRRYADTVEAEFKEVEIMTGRE